MFKVSTFARAIRGRETGEELAGRIKKGLVGLSCAVTGMVAAMPMSVSAAPCPNAGVRGGASSDLPDCRAYEMVSPVDKNGGDIQALGPPAGGGEFSSYKQGALEGERVTYTSATAFGDAVAGPYSSQYLSSRGPSGWSTHGISQPRGNSFFEGRETLPALNWDTANLFEAFSSDLCNAWVKDTNVVPLTPDGLVGHGNLYRRSNCGIEGYEALTSGGPGPASPYLNDASEPGLEITAPGPGVRFQGATADLSHQLFFSGAQLLPDPVGSEARCFTSTNAETVSYRWLRNGVPIEGETGSRYTFVPADFGAAIQCQVFAFNSGGGTTQVANKARVVGAFPPTPVPIAPNTLPPPCDISLPNCNATTGALKVGGAGGQTLTCNPQAEDWRNLPVSFSYRWYRNAAEIPGATASTYVVTKEDLATRATFQCEAIATNAGGSVAKVSNHRPTSPAPSPLVPCSGPSSAPNFCSPSATTNKSTLYDLHEGQLEIVGVLPNGKANPENSLLGRPGSKLEAILENAISLDGSRIFWASTPNALPSFGSMSPDELYVRIDGERTLAISDAVDPDPKLKAKYWTAATDGSAVLFTMGEQFADVEALYEFDVDAALAGDPEPERLIAKGVPGVLGAADDLSRIYFASEESLAPGSVPGEWNLYLEEDGATELVAVLGEHDRRSHEHGLSPIRDEPFLHASRVTPSGGQIAFQALTPLTAYDNFNPATGKRYSEVYRYDAVSDQLICVSCNPSGEPPSGPPIKAPYHASEASLGSPEFQTQYGQAGTLPTCENEHYCSRVVSEDGNRIFFHSNESLENGDSNGGVKDVYQWEAQGTGSCETAGGCIDLISTGTSAQISEFLDASAEGADVFFSTTSSIDPRDPASIDVYDAKVGGGFPIPPKQPDCLGDSCQPVPEQPARQPVASAVFDGPEGLRRGARCKSLARRAAKLARLARRTDSDRLQQKAERARKRLRKCRRAGSRGSR